MSSNFIYFHSDVFINFTIYTPWVYFVLVVFLYISPVHDLICHCIIVISVFFIFFFILYLCLQQYFFVPYTTYYLVVLNIGKIVIYISWVWVVLTLYHCPHWHVFMIVDWHIFVLIYHLVVECIKHVSLFLIHQSLIYFLLL